MPLSPEEKNLLAGGGQLALQTAIVEGAGLGILGTGLLGLVFLPLALGISAQLNRPRFPRLSIGDFGSAAAAARQGFQISSDPFFGDVVISHADQVDNLTELVRNSAVRRVAALQDNSRLFLERRGVIEGLAETAEARGFAATVDPDFRGAVVRDTADSPLRVIERDFLL